MGKTQPEDPIENKKELWHIAKFKLRNNCIQKHRDPAHQVSRCKACASVRKASLLNRKRHYANQKVGEANFRAFVRFQYPAITVSDRAIHLLFKSSQNPSNYGTPLAKPRVKDVKALAKKFKEKSIEHKKVVDPLAISDQPISNFIKEIKPTNALEGDHYFVKKMVASGNAKTPEFSDVFAAPYERWRGENNFIFAAPSGHLADLVWPFFSDQAKEFCAMFAPTSWADTCGEPHRKHFLGSLMRARNDSCFFKLNCGENSWYISTASERKGVNLFRLHGGYGLQAEFDASLSDEYNEVLDEFISDK